MNSSEAGVGSKSGDQAGSTSKSGQGRGADNEAKRSHRNQPLYFQWNKPKMTKTKPRRPSSIVLIAYGHFDRISLQVATDDATVYVADSGYCDGEPKQSETKPL